MFLRLGQQTHYNTKILRITPNSETAMNFIEINKSESDNFFLRELANIQTFSK